MDNRYSKHYLFKPIGEDGQKKLLDSRIVIVGVGALGTALANLMVRSGVGYVRIIDNDIVELSNLQRQILFDESDAINKIPKVEAAKNKLQAINSTITIEEHFIRLDKNNAEELLGNVDLILDGSDNFETRYLINDVSIKLNIPWIYGGVAGAYGMTHTIIPTKTPCLKCLFPEPPNSYNTGSTIGIVAPIIQTITSYQAIEALKYLVGDYKSLSASMINIDLWKNDYVEIKTENAKNPNCPVCVNHQFNYLN